MNEKLLKVNNEPLVAIYIQGMKYPKKQNFQDAGIIINLES